MGTRCPWKVIRANLNKRNTLVQEIPFNDLRVFGVHSPSMPCMQKKAATWTLLNLLASSNWFPSAT